MTYVDDSLYVIGSALRDKRKKLKLSQRDVAALADVTQATVANLEQASYNPSYKTITQVADALGLEIKLQSKRKP